MNKLCLLSIIVFVISSMVSAQVREPASMGKDSKREMMIRKIEANLDRSAVIEFLRKCYVEMNNAAKFGKDFPASKYYSFSVGLNAYLDYKWFIADTGLSKKWLSSVQELLKYLYKTKDIIQTCTHNNQTNTVKYKQAVKYYNVAYGRFVKLIKNPVKVSPKLQRKLKLQKALWQKAMRKKYKIDKKAEPDFL